MADKITTVPKTKVGTRVGRLDDEDVVRLNRALLMFPAHCNSVFSRNVDLDTFTFLQAERLNYDIGKTDCQAVAPLENFHFGTSD